MSLKDVTAIILAAGKGTRIKSNKRNKVVYELAGKPMVAYAVDNLKRAGFDSIVAVIGYAQESVKQVLGKKVIYAIQKKRLGTGHAFKVGFSKVPAASRHVVSVYGDDSAFYPPKLIRKMVASHKKSGAGVTFVTIKKKDPTGLGRIIRDKKGEVMAIVEEKNAAPVQKKIKEINTGLYCFKKDFVDDHIDKMKRNPVTKEYYLPDLIGIAKAQGLKVKALLWKDASVWFGVNTEEQLKQADKLMRQRLRNA